MQNDRLKMKLSKRTDRSYLRRQRQSENLLHRSEKKLQIWPNRRDGVSGEEQYRQCDVSSGETAMPSSNT